MHNILEYLEMHSNDVENRSIFGDKNGVLTYESMCFLSQKIGSAIAKSGKIHRPVAVYLDKSIDGLACFFGTIYSGNFYVPIDREMPLERIKNIFQVLKPIAVISDK